MKESQWPEVVHNVHYLWTARDGYFIYVPITKCASTYLGNAIPTPEFDSRAWQFRKPYTGLSVPDPRHTKWFTILRDPVSRWISGATHWLSHCDKNTWHDHIDRVLTEIEMDVHTCPQSLFLQDIPRDQLIAMAYQPNIDQHPWFRQQGWILKDPSGEYYNATQRHDIVRVLHDRLTPRQQKTIQDYYHQDYELIRTARFI